MADWANYLKPLGMGNPMTPGLNKAASGFWGGMKDMFMGTPQRFEQTSNLSPEQMQGQNQLMGAANGAYQTAADYYRGLLSNESPDMAAFAAPEMRRFNEQTIPGLAEQFAGMGAGGSGLSGSAFRNQLGGAATDLSERLASMRAGLRQNAAQGLQSIGQQSLQPYMQNYNVPAQQGLLSTALPAALGAVGTAFGGPFLGAAGAAAGDWASKMFGGASASPRSGYSTSSAFPGRQFDVERD